MLGSDQVSPLVLLFQSTSFLKTVYLELLLELIASKSSFPASIFLRAEDDTATGSTEAFLSSKLHYTRDQHGQEICLLREGDKEVGVMMGWERDISEYPSLHSSRRSAQELLGTPKCERR